MERSDNILQTMVIFRRRAYEVQREDGTVDSSIGRVGSDSSSLVEKFMSKAILFVPDEYKISIDELVGMLPKSSKASLQLRSIISELETVKEREFERGHKSAVRECYQIAQSHEFGPDAAKTIRETFGLEI